MAARSSKPPRNPRAGAASPRRFSDAPLARAALACGLLLLAVAVLYRELVFGGKVFFAPDSQSAGSLVAAGKKILAGGTYPLWNPYLFSGMPSFGSLCFTPYVYPVNFVLGWFVRYLFFPEYTWLLFHTFLAGLGTFLLLKDRGVRVGASLAAGVLMMWMPNLVAAGANGHGSQACAVAYLPLALLFWDRLWRGGMVLNAAALALVLGLSMLRGHLQISYYTYALVGLHAAFFGVLRIVDGARGRVADTSPLPERMLARLSGPSASALRRSITEVTCAWAVLVLVVGVSIAMSAVLYLPVSDYAEHSIRGASIAGGLDYGYATMWSLHPSEMLTFLIPHSFGFGKELYLGHMPFTDYPNYLGVVVLAFAVVAVAGVRTRWVAFLATAWVVATLVSFGNFFPVLYNPLFKFMPFFSKFRVPVMVLIVQQLATVGLFATGLDAVLGATTERARTLSMRALIAAAVVFAAAVLSQGYWTGGFVAAVASKVRATTDPDQQRQVAHMVGEFLAHDVFQIALIALLAVGAVAAFARRRINAAMLAALVLVFGAADYYRVDRFILHPETFLHYDGYRIIHDKSDAERFKTSDEMVEFLHAQPGPFRIVPVDGAQPPGEGDTPPISFETQGFFASNRFMVFDIASVGGYHPAKLQDYEEFIGALKFSLQQGRLNLLDMMNVRYIVSGARLSEHRGLRPVWGGRDYEGQPRAIYENLGVYPRAWVVGEYRVETPEETLALMANGEVDLRHTVLLDRKPALEPAPGDSAVVTMTQSTPHEVAFEVTLDRPGIVVVSEVYYPDWRATVDGSVTEVLRANHVLRALALPAGRHRVVFSYDASLVREGATISIATLVLTLLALGGAAFARRRGTR